VVCWTAPLFSFPAFFPLNEIPSVLLSCSSFSSPRSFLLLVLSAMSLATSVAGGGEMLRPHFFCLAWVCDVIS